MTTSPEKNDSFVAGLDRRLRLNKRALSILMGDLMVEARNHTNLIQTLDAQPSLSEADEVRRLAADERINAFGRAVNELRRQIDADEEAIADLLQLSE